jgi:hypothetical protein
LIGAACLSAGWLVASLVTPPVARLQSLPVRRAEAPSETRGATLDTPPVLRQPVVTTSAPPVARRNPFVFGRAETTAGASSPSAAGDVTSGDVPQEPMAPTVEAPPYRLSGIAITGDVRTAVLSDGTAVRLVQVGQTLGRYTVVAVTDNTVTLTDSGGAAFVLRLH